METDTIKTPDASKEAPVVPTLPPESVPVIKLLRMLDHCYPDRLVAFFNEKGELVIPGAEPVDSLAVALISEVTGTFDPVKHHVDQVADAWDTISGMQDLLFQTAQNLRSNLVAWVIFDFLSWLFKSKRSQFTLDTFEAWIEVHPSDRVREMRDNLLSTLVLVMPLSSSDRATVHKTADFKLEEILVRIWADLHVGD